MTIGTITPRTFEFKEWKDCFETWCGDEPVSSEQMQLVISTHPYTSGYYIEAKGTELTKGDLCYTGKEIYELERRVIAEIALAEREERSPRFTT